MGLDYDLRAIRAQALGAWTAEGGGLFAAQGALKREGRNVDTGQTGEVTKWATM